MSADAADIFRTAEIEEASNRYLIHPASRLLVSGFARFDISPNTVSALGMLSALLAALCFYRYQQWQMVVAGCVFLFGWHVFDGADGQLARLTGKTSETGKIVDGLCDHLGMAMIYISLSMVLAAELGPWVWLLSISAGMSHVVQAGAFEYQRDMYDCWVHGKTHKCVPTVNAREADGLGGLNWRRPVHALYVIYLRLQYRFAAADNRLLALHQAFDPADAASERARQRYRECNLPAVRRWSWLSANKRSAAMGVLCLLQIPLGYFLLELVLLNGLLWWLWRRQQQLNLGLYDELLQLLPESTRRQV